MAKNIIMGIILFIWIAGCSTALPNGERMKTGEVVKPPSGLVDWRDRE